MNVSLAELKGIILVEIGWHKCCCRVCTPCTPNDAFWEFRWYPRRNLAPVSVESFFFGPPEPGRPPSLSPALPPPQAMSKNPKLKSASPFSRVIYPKINFAQIWAHIRNPLFTLSPLNLVSALHDLPFRSYGVLKLFHLFPFCTPFPFLNRLFYGIFGFLSSRRV